jgi:hypothetical protein
MELKNKQVNYSCTNEDVTLKLQGTVSLNESKRITSFNGSFYLVETNAYAGEFYYSETEDGKISKSTNNIPAEYIEEACDFLVATANEIKETVIL